MSCSKVRSPAIDPITGDTVLPLRLWDSNFVFPKLIVNVTFRYNDVLDTQKLRQSLDRLVTIGSWHQIGSRYKKNVSLSVVILKLRCQDLVHGLLIISTGKGKHRASYTSDVRRDKARIRLVP